MARIAGRRQATDQWGWIRPFRIIGKVLRGADPDTQLEDCTMQSFDTVVRFAQDEEGVTAIEYGLIAALIAVVIIGAVTSVGTGLRDVFNDIAAALGVAP